MLDLEQNDLYKGTRNIGEIIDEENEDERLDVVKVIEKTVFVMGSSLES